MSQQSHTDDDVDFYDLVAESEQATDDFEIAQEIDEINADESSRASCSVLRETALMHWWQSRRKELRP